MELVKQVSFSAYGQACIAMITGKKIEEVIRTGRFCMIRNISIPNLV